MENDPSPSLEASLLQRWFPVARTDRTSVAQIERFSETDLRDISDVLRRLGRGAWSRVPRIYVVLRRLDRLDVIDLFIAQDISDVYFPFTLQTLPQSLIPSVAHEFLQAQQAVLSSALDLERETGRHRHFSSTNDVPFIKVEELGKGAYGYVDRVSSTISHREYARKLIPRGRTFQRNQKVLRDFERELGTLKKLCQHRHIVRLIGSYTDPRYVGILMLPVADCDLKDFLSSCASKEVSIAQSRRSFARSFFGCLTSALSYLHDNMVRHKDIKPQNVLVSQHTVYLTDFGISLDWSEMGKETTTGPTPKTARYCAPEVSDYAPRNTSSDMWSLGCILLEIWTVLKGETVENMYAFLEAHGTLSSCYHLNQEAVHSWIEDLERKTTLADNAPLYWIRHLLVQDKQKRWTARQLFTEIEVVNNDPGIKFAFCGQCCMDEFEGTESVISSSGSLSNPGDIQEVFSAPPSVELSTMKLGGEEQIAAPSQSPVKGRHTDYEAATSQTLHPVTIEDKEDVVMPSEKSVQTSDKTFMPAKSQLVSTGGDSFSTNEMHESIAIVASKPPEVSVSPPPNVESSIVRHDVSFARSTGTSNLDAPASNDTALKHKNSVIPAIEQDQSSTVGELSRNDSTHEVVVSAAGQQFESQTEPSENIAPHVQPLERDVARETDSDNVAPQRRFSFELDESQSSAHDLETTLGLVHQYHALQPVDEPSVSAANELPATGLKPSEPVTSASKTRRICGLCNESLTGQFVRALSNTFHLDCFTCVDCGDIVASRFFPLPGKISNGRHVVLSNPDEGHTQEVPLCETDYFRRLELLCQTCGLALRGTYITALDRKYHVEHFVCVATGCEVIFGAHDSYYEHEEQILCEPHYRDFAPVCHGCGTWILKQFVEDHDRSWHPGCYSIKKYWGIIFKNEFADSITKRQPSLRLGEVVSEATLRTSVDQTMKLTAMTWSVMAAFEESCAASITSILQATEPNGLQVLSASGYLVLKLEILFLAIDQADRTREARKLAKKASTREKKILCKDVVRLFSLMTAGHNTKSREVSELLADSTGISYRLKKIVKGGLDMAVELDPQGNENPILTFLMQVETATKIDMAQRLQDENYVGSDAEMCTLCHTRLEDKLGQGFYWTHKQAFHVDCITCPSCSNYPTVVQGQQSKSHVECTQCDFGDMLSYITGMFGERVVILHSRLSLFAHLLWVAWYRMADYMGHKDISLLVRSLTPPIEVEERNEEEADVTQVVDVPAPPSCPSGWTAYWSKPASSYIFKDLQTGMWRWELPDPDMADNDVPKNTLHTNYEQGAIGNAAIAELPSSLVDSTSQHKGPLGEVGHESNGNIGTEHWLHEAETPAESTRDIIGLALTLQVPSEHVSAPDDSSKRKPTSRRSGFFSKWKR